MKYDPLLLDEREAHNLYQGLSDEQKQLITEKELANENMYNLKFSNNSWDISQNNNLSSILQLEKVFVPCLVISKVLTSVKL